MKRGLFVLLAGVVLPASLGAQARDTAVLDTLLVTSKRYPALRTEIPQKVEVITRRDIERTVANELADVLKKQAAVDVIQYPGLLSGIGIRGFRPEFSGTNKRTLLLIDGRPAGAPNLATIDLNAIERIEVLKGPVSSLYGSSAMGGAVNLITRRSTGPIRGQGSVAYGSFQTLDASARMGGSIASWFDTDLGFTRFVRGEDYRIGDGNVLRDLVGDTEATKVFDNGRSERVQDVGDGLVRPNTQYAYGSGHARLGFRIGSGLRADVRGEVFQADDVETPGDIFTTGGDGRKNLQRRTGDLSVSGRAGAFAPLLRIFGTEEDTEFQNISNVADPFVSFVSASETRGAQLQNIALWGPHALTAGVDVTHVDVESRSFSAADTPSRPFSPNSANRSFAGFAEAKLGLLGDRMTATLGGRVDRITLEVRETLLRPDVVPREDQFTVFNPSAGVQYTSPVGFRVHGSAGRAFVAPDAFNRAGLAVARNTQNVASITVGNADLRPEHSVSWDAGVGVEHRGTGIDADLTYFRTHVDDRITSVRASFPSTARPRTVEGDQVGTVTTYANANQAAMSGLEGRLAYDLGARVGYRYSLRLFANGTRMLRAEETTRSLLVDAARFAGRSNFRPEEVAGAVTFGSDTTVEIRNVADLTLGYGVEWDDLRRLSLRLSGRYVGERLDRDFTDFSNPADVRYPPFMTLDLVSTVRVAERFRVGFNVGNLTDENYYEKRGYPLEGRSFRLSLGVGF